MKKMFLTTTEAKAAGLPSVSEQLDAYNAAVTKNNAAIKAYHAARDAYRAKQIGDDEFLAARATYNEAMGEFDIAFAKAAS